jgi:hypothetical protein
MGAYISPKTAYISAYSPQGLQALAL